MNLPGNLKNPRIWIVALSAGVTASLAILPQARGEIVYENGAQVRADDRNQLRQVLGASEKAQATIAVQGQAQAPQQVILQPVQVQAAPAQTVQVIPTAPITAPASVEAVQTAELQNLSKTELMRRERVREELKNEDILQERLEELRLRDEQKRTNQVLGAQASAGAVAPKMEDVVVAAPLTERSPTSQVLAPPANPTAVLVSQPAAVTVATASAPESSSEATRFLIQPRGGLSEMSGYNGYDVRPHYTAGLGLGVEASDNLTFETGYTYSEYGVSANSTNPYVVNYQYWATMNGYSASFEPVSMKQNVIDAGLKLHFLGPDAKVRPFLGGGAAYSKTYINYDQQILDNMNQYDRSNMGRDYEVASYLGYLSAGLDIRVHKNVSVGAIVKYYTVLSSRQTLSANGNGAALYGGYLTNGGYGAPYGAMGDADKQAIGGSLAKSSFYTVLGGVSFSF